MLLLLSVLSLGSTPGIARASLVDREAAVSSAAEREPQRVLFEAPGPVRGAGAAGPASLAPVSNGFLSMNDAPDNDMPRQLAFTADGTQVLVVGRDTDNLTFFDVATGLPTTTIDVGDFPVDVAVTADNRVAVVPNVFGNSVSVIDVATRSVLGTVPITGDQPFAVALTPDSNFALVAVADNGGASSVSVIDLNALMETRTFATTPQGAIGFFFGPEPGIFGNLFTDFDLSPDGTQLVLADGAGAKVTVYDVASGAVLASLPVAAGPDALDISPDSQLAVVEHGGNNKRISTIDLMALTVTHSFVMPDNLTTLRIRVTPDKSHAIVGISNAVQFVNLTTGAVTATISTGTVGDIQISFDGAYAVVANFNTRVIDIASQSQVASLSIAPTADMATSPVELKAVGLNNRFREDVHFYSIDGGSSSFLSRALSGEPDEGDAPRTLGMAPDGNSLVVVNNTSSNAAIVDVATGAIRTYIPTGIRSLGVAISADSQTALITNTDSHTVTQVDLTTDSVVNTFSTPSRPGEVLISPDGQTGYVASIAGTDRIWFLDLGTGSVLGSLVAGQMGSITYTYGVLSGMALSPDGSVLAVCISFDDELLLIDTASRSVITRVNVGDFPIRVAFAPDGSRAYVTHSFSNDLSIVSIAGGASMEIGVVPGITFPLQVDVDATGAFAYVGSWAAGAPHLRVVDTANMTSVASVPLSSSPRSTVFAGSDLWVSLTGGDLVRIDAAGPATSVVDSIALSGSPSDLALSLAFGVAYAAQPGAQDGLDVIGLMAPEPYCVGAPNSTGMGASISSEGTTSVTNNDFLLRASDLPDGVPGLFFYGPNQIQAPFGDGFRCVGGSVQRLFPPAQSMGGVAQRMLDFTIAPVGSGPRQITPGSSWNFQFWHRDPSGPGGSGFNLTNGLGATFTP